MRKLILILPLFIISCVKPTEKTGFEQTHDYKMCVATIKGKLDGMKMVSEYSDKPDIISYEIIEIKKTGDKKAVGVVYIEYENGYRYTYSINIFKKDGLIYSDELSRIESTYNDLHYDHGI